MTTFRNHLRGDRTRGAYLLSLWVIALCVAWPAPAQAHTDLVGSTPSAGDSVSVRTERLVLVFNEDLGAAAGQVVVRDEAGTDVTAGEPVIAGQTLEQPLALVVAGRHRVAYRITGSDGHPVIGTFTFDAVGEVSARRRAGSTEAASAALANVPPAASPPGWASSPATWWLLAAAILAALVLFVRRAVGRPTRPRS